MDLSGDGIKEASKSFQQAAWVFDHLRTLVTNLQPTETSIDFTAESLGCLTNLMLAQAQYLFYRKAMEAGMKSSVLAKIAMQISEYFKKSYELSITNQSIKTYDSGRFSNIQNYHHFYFRAMSFMVLGIDTQKNVAETGKGMGLAVGYLRESLKILDQAKAVVGLIPSNYQENFNKKYEEITKTLNKAVDQNKSIYFEPEIKTERLPVLDLQNFVKLDSCLEVIQQKNPLEDKLRHLVPPEVRVMQTELKTQLQNLLNQEFEKEAQVDSQLRSFLATFGLPQTLQALSSNLEIPLKVWEKVEDFQKKGGVPNIKGMISGVALMKQNVHQMMQQMLSTLQEEEIGDNMARQQYGGMWTRHNSEALTQQFKHQIQDLTNKAIQAAEADMRLEQKFTIQGACLDLLGKTRNDLTAMIPQSGNQVDTSSNPTVVAIQRALDTFDSIKEQKSKVLDEATQKCQNLNVVEQLMAVRNHQAEKGTVYQQEIAKFQAVFAPITTLNLKVDETKAVITQNAQAFNSLVSQHQNESGKQLFYKQIDDALSLFNEVTNMLHQGNNFYQQLMDYLLRLDQTIKDFVTSRNLEKNDMIGRLSGFRPPQ